MIYLLWLIIPHYPFIRPLWQWTISIHLGLGLLIVPCPMWVPFPLVLCWLFSAMLFLAFLVSVFLMESTVMPSWEFSQWSLYTSLSGQCLFPRCYQIGAFSAFVEVWVSVFSISAVIPSAPGALPFWIFLMAVATSSFVSGLRSILSRSCVGVGSAVLD